MAGYPTTRMRRLRENPGLRRLVEETRLSASDFTYPLFVTHGRDTRTEIPPMPGIYQLSLDQLIHEVGEAADAGYRERTAIRYSGSQGRNRVPKHTPEAELSKRRLE